MTFTIPFNRRNSHDTTPNRQLGTSVLILAAVFLATLCLAPPLQAFVVNIYASANGTGTACSSTTPCSLAQAQFNLEHTAGVGTSCTTPAAVNVILANNFYPNVSLTLTSADSGCDSSHLVTWEGAGTGHASLSGGIQVPSASTGSSWTFNSTLNIWQIKVPNVNFEIAFFNHHRIYRPHLPTSGYHTIVSSYPAPTNANCMGPNDWDGNDFVCTDRFSYTSGDFQTSWANYNSEIEVVDFQRWTSSTARLSSLCLSSCGGTSTAPVAIMTGTMAANPTDSLGFITGHNYLIENIKEQLTSEQGTWYLARNTADTTYDPYGDATHYTLNYNPLPSDSFGASSVIVVAQQPQVLVATNLSNTTFTGLYFGQDNYVVPTLGYAAVQSDRGSPVGGTIPAMVSCNQCGNVVFNNDLFWETSGHALEFVGTPTSAPSTTYYGQVTGSTFLDVGDIAVKLGSTASMGDTSANVAQKILVQNSLMRSIARRFVAGGCVTIMISHDNTIENNECYDTYNAGITVGTVFGNYSMGCPSHSQNCVTGNLVQNNLLHDINQGVTFDLGAIYHSNGVDTGNTDNGNIIHDVVTNPTPISLSDVGAAGIYVDNDSSGVTIEYNLVYHVNGSIFSGGTVVPGGNGYALRHHDGGIAPATVNTIQNNILGMASTAPFTRMKAEDSLNMNVTNNIFFSDLNTVSSGCAGTSPCAAMIGESIGFACSMLTTPWSAVACKTRFDFEGNDYYNLASGNRVDFTICKVPESMPCMNPATQLNHFTFAGWTATTGCTNPPATQNPCEDNGTPAGANNNPNFTNAVCTNPQSPALDFHVGGSSLGGFNYTNFTGAGTYSAGTTSTPLQAPGGNSADVTVSFPTNVPSNACTAF